MASLHKILENYRDQPRPAKLLAIRLLLENLTNLEHETMTSSEIDYRDAIVNGIKGFGIVAGIPHVDNCQFTDNQFVRLNKIIGKEYRNGGPTKLCRIDMIGLSSEAAALFTNLIDGLSSKSLISSQVTAHVLDFFALMNIMAEDGYYVSNILEYVTKVLVRHGWTDGGFNSPPDRQAILVDLQALLGTGVWLPK
jgi:hypothetical protein